MRRRFHGPVLALAALTGLCVLAFGGRAAGAAGSYQTATFLFDQTKPDRSTGAAFQVDYQNPSDPQGKPPVVRRVVLEGAPGFWIDTSVPERCTASDAELTLLGPQACPPGSQVGVGAATVDSGVPGPARFVPAHIDFFNNAKELIFLNTVQGTGARTVIRGRAEGRRITTDVGMLPGSPPDGGAIDTAQTNLSARSSGGRAYLTTPAVCPSSGRWINSATFTYADGVTQTVDSQTPCEPGVSKAAKKCRRQGHRHKHPSTRKHHRKRCGRHGKHRRHGGGAR
jgi:hypothetical protein